MGSPLAVAKTGGRRSQGAGEARGLAKLGGWRSQGTGEARGLVKPVGPFNQTASWMVAVWRLARTSLAWATLQEPPEKRCQGLRFQAGLDQVDCHAMHFATAVAFPRSKLAIGPDGLKINIPALHR
jgi:hypothetical protein